MFNQVKVSLPQNEFSALVKLALGELRDPPTQVRQIVRQELIRRGLLTDEPKCNDEPKGKKA
jgi:hypothetical protein